MSRRPASSIVASPVLIGAVTLLVTIVAVFLAYNANTGLPFVPTYDVKAQLPSGAKLVKGNEVRVGGFRVGLVEDIKPTVVNGKSVALVSLKLDKTVDPLAVDTTIRVRPRSALGLRYVQITPGTSDKTLAAGDTIPLAQTSESLDLEDIYAVFQGKTRDDARAATTGFGDAFAGRGASINEAIASLNPFFTALTPVMQNLADPRTDLDQFFRGLGRASAEAAPVAHAQAEVFTHMADTFEAIVREPESLRQTIEKSPPTLDVSIESLRVQRPFLEDFADLSARLRPAAQELPRSLPAINDALRVGTPILPQTDVLNENLEDSFNALDDLFQGHEIFYRVYLHLPEEVSGAIYAVVAAALAIVYRSYLRTLPWRIALVALALFSFSEALDFLYPQGDTEYELLLEDGSKFAGIAAWALFVVWGSQAVLLHGVRRRDGESLETA